MKAWIIIWNWVGEHAKHEKPLVNILSARNHPKAVLQYVDFYYTSETSSVQEKIDQAKYNKPSLSPYQADFERIDGVEFQGLITCGHNPYLEAFVADNIRAADTPYGITWETTSLDRARRVAREWIKMMRR